ncbi:MAG TPA: hypothetical protein VFJ16_30060 [Longimicrobium sp.]|nr:hypothetical protein [Longimicrobium sp.]
MQRIHMAGAAVLAALALGAAPLRGQDWAPPSRQMPEMPASGDLNGGWKGSLGGWFGGLGVQVESMRATGEGGGARPRFVRFTSNMRPVEQWADRNGDGRADMIEVYRDGALAFQLVDADYDGRANTLRVFNGGSLAREERY